MHIQLNLIQCILIKFGELLNFFLAIYCCDNCHMMRQQIIIQNHLFSCIIKFACIIKQGFRVVDYSSYVQQTMISTLVCFILFSALFANNCSPRLSRGLLLTIMPDNYPAVIINTYLVIVCPNSHEKSTKIKLNKVGARELELV